MPTTVPTYIDVEDTSFGILAPYHDSVDLHGRAIRVDLTNFNSKTYNSELVIQSVKVVDFCPPALNAMCRDSITNDYNHSLHPDCGMVGYAGAFSDVNGEFAYFVPQRSYGNMRNAKINRVRIADFQTNEYVDLSKADPDLGGFVGGYAAGKWAYLLPHFNGNVFSSKIARVNLDEFDTPNPSIEVLDLADANVELKGFYGGFMIGSHGYLVPDSTIISTGFNESAGFSNSHTGSYNGKLTRVNLGAFSAATVEHIDLAKINPELKGFRGGLGFEGYVFLAPYNNGVPHGNVVRVTASDFSTVNQIDLTKLHPQLRGFNGCFLDNGGRNGKYIYFVPSKNNMAGSDYHGWITRILVDEYQSASELMNQITVGPENATTCWDWHDTLEQRGACYQATHAIAQRLNSNNRRYMQYFDLTVVDDELRGFAGGFASGNFGYLIPQYAGRGRFSGKLVRINRIFFTPEDIKIFELTEASSNLVGFNFGFEVVEGGSALAPPEGLTYIHLDARYTVNVPIDRNAPSYFGGMATTVSISQGLNFGLNLPTGLTFDAKSGVIEGAPLSQMPLEDYRVTLSNSAGSVSTIISIKVDLGNFGYLLPNAYSMVVRLNLNDFKTCTSIDVAEQLGRTGTDSDPVPGQMALRGFTGGFVDEFDNLFLAPNQIRDPVTNQDVYSGEVVKVFLARTDAEVETTIVDLSVVGNDPDLKGFIGGGIFNGWGYFYPAYGMTNGTSNGKVVRVKLDTWPAVDPTTGQAEGTENVVMEVLDLASIPLEQGYNIPLMGFMNGLFLDKYLFLVPNYATVYHGRIPMIDTTQFETSSVQVRDLREIDGDLKGFAGGFLHDIYAILVPYYNGLDFFGKGVRVDLTQVTDFSSTSVDVVNFPDLGNDPELVGFKYGIASADYLYFIPYTFTKLVRVAQATWPATFAGESASNAVVQAIDVHEKGFIGAMLQADHIYLCPHYRSNGDDVDYSGVVVRVEINKFTEVSVFNMEEFDFRYGGFWDGVYHLAVSFTYEYVENDPAIQLFPTISLKVIDAVVLFNLEIEMKPSFDLDMLWLPNNEISGGDSALDLVDNGQTIRWVVRNGIVGQWDINQGVLSLMGSSSRDNYEAMLQEVEYFSFSEDPVSVRRTILVRVNNKIMEKVAINVHQVNDPPVMSDVTLDIRYVERDPPMYLCETTNIQDVEWELYKQTNSIPPMDVDVAKAYDSLRQIELVRGAVERYTLKKVELRIVQNYEVEVDFLEIPTLDDTDQEGMSSQDETGLVSISPGTRAEPLRSYATVMNNTDGQTGIANTISQLGISTLWNSTTGTLTLEGAAPFDFYAAVMRTIKFRSYATTGGLPKLIHYAMYDGTELNDQVLAAATEVIMISKLVGIRAVHMQADDYISSEVGKEARFTVLLTVEPSAPVLIATVSSNEEEGKTDPTFIVITGDNWFSGMQIVVNGVNDGKADGDTPYYAVVVPLTSEDKDYLAHPEVQVPLLNLDDPVNNVAVRANPRQCSTAETGTTCWFNVNVTGWHSSFERLTVTFESSNPVEGQLEPRTEDEVEGAGTAVAVCGMGQDYEVEACRCIGNTPGACITATITQTPTECTVTLANGNQDFVKAVASCKRSQLEIRHSHVFVADPSFLDQTIVGSWTYSLKDEGATMYIKGIDDEEADLLKYYRIDLTADVKIQNIDESKAVSSKGMDSVIECENEDDEVAELLVHETTCTTIDGELVTSEAGENCIFMATLSSKPYADVILTSTSSNVLEGRVSQGGTVSFTPQNYNVPQMIIVAGQNDDLVDGHIPYTMTIEATSLDYAYRDQVYLFQLKNLDNSITIAVINQFGKTIQSPASPTDETGSTTQFELKLDEGEPTFDVTVQIIVTKDQVEDDAECRLDKSTLIFGKNDWGAFQNITVTGQDDDVQDGKQGVRVELNFFSDDPVYAGFEWYFFMYNYDDDGLDISIPSCELQEAANAATVSFTVASEIPAGGSIDALFKSAYAECTIPTAPSATLSSATASGWTVSAAFGAGNKVSIDVGSQPIPAGTTLVLAVEPVVCNSAAGVSRVSIETLANGAMIETMDETSQSVLSVIRSDPEPCVALLTIPEGSWLSGAYDRMVWSVTVTNENVAQVTQTEFIFNETHREASLVVVPVDNFIDAPDASTTVIFSGHIYFSHHTNLGVSEKVSIEQIEFNVKSFDDDNAEIIFGGSNIRCESCLSKVGWGYCLAGAETTYLMCEQGTALGPSSGAFCSNWLFGPGAACPTTPICDELGNAEHYIKVFLTTQPTASVSIPVSTTDDTEGNTCFSVAECPTVLGWTPATWDQQLVIRIKGIDDDVVDYINPFTIQAGPSVSDDQKFNGVSRSNNYVTEDDDSIGFGLDVIVGLSSECGDVGVINANLNSEPTAPILFSASSQDATEGIPDPSIFVLSQQNWYAGMDISVLGQMDNEDDGLMLYRISVMPITTNDPDYKSISGRIVDVHNEDDPVNKLQIGVSPLSCATSETTRDQTCLITILPSHWETTGRGQFVSLRVTASLRSGDETEGELTFDNENYATVLHMDFDETNYLNGAQFTIVGVDDDVMDGDKEYRVVISAVIETLVHPAGKIISPKKIAGNANPDVNSVNKDDDVAGVSYYRTCNQTSEAGDQCDIVYSLGSRPTHPVTFKTVSSNVNEGKPINGHENFVWDPVEWQVEKVISIEGIDDGAADEDAPYVVTVGPLISEDPNYSGRHFVLPFINKNMFLTSLIITQDGERISGKAKATDESGTIQTLNIQLPMQPAFPVMVTATSNDVTEVRVSPEMFVLSGTEEQIVTLIGQNDDASDGDQEVKITLETDSKDPAYAKGVIIWHMLMMNNDDDGVVTNTTECHTYETAAMDGSGANGDLGTSCGVSLHLPAWREEFESVTFDIQSTTDSEATCIPDTLTYNSDNWDIDQEFAVFGVNDLIQDGPKPYKIVILGTIKLAPSHSSYDADMIKSELSGINEDDDVAGIIARLGSTVAADGMVACGGNHTSEDGVHGLLSDFQSDEGKLATVGATQKCVAVEVRLLTQPNGRSVVSVPISLSEVSKPNNGGTRFEGQTADSPITFSEENWRDWQVAKIYGVDDDVVDYDTEYTVFVGPTISDDIWYNGDQNQPHLQWQTQLVNEDDDKVDLLLEYKIDEDTDMITDRTSETGELSASFYVRIGSKPKSTVLFTVTSSKPGEGKATPSILAFSEDDWKVNQVVTVIGEDDSVPDGDVRYRISVVSLYTADPDYGAPAVWVQQDPECTSDCALKNIGGSLLGDLGFINEDDGIDEDDDACSAGSYGRIYECMKKDAQDESLDCGETGVCLMLKDESSYRPDDPNNPKCDESLWGPFEPGVPKRVADCKDCPIGSFSDVLSQPCVDKPGECLIETPNDCKHCPRGMYGTASGKSTPYADISGDQGCRPCAMGQFQNLIGMAACQTCIGEDAHCPTGTWLPSYGTAQSRALNFTSFTEGTLHQWTTPAQKVYRAVWNFAGGMTMTETSLPYAVTLAGWSCALVVWSLIFIVYLGFKVDMWEEQIWIDFRSKIVKKDYFEEEHSAYVGDQEEGPTFLGGMTTIFFMLWAYGLLGLTAWLYTNYNELVIQSLAPKTEATVKDLRPDIEVTVDFLGYTGPPIALSDGDTALAIGEIGYDKFGRPIIQTNGAIGQTEMSIVSTEANRLQIRWKCGKCQILAAPQVQILIKRSSGNSEDLYSGDKLISCRAIKWKVESTPIVTDEINVVNGTIIPPFQDSCFRGQNPTYVQISLIPTNFANFVTGEMAEGFRVQHLSEKAGSIARGSDFMNLPSTKENAVRLSSFYSFSSKPDFYCSLVENFIFLDHGHHAASNYCEQENFFVPSMGRRWWLVWCRSWPRDYMHEYDRVCLVWLGFY
jgi:hypothetical protein